MVNLADKFQDKEETDIMPDAVRHRRPVFNPMGRIESLAADETKIADIRRHPFGLFLIYIQVMVGLAVAAVFIFGFLPSLTSGTGSMGSQITGLFLGIGSIVVVMALIMLLLVTRIYQSNQLIVSDVNVTQVLQTGLFSRKVSELSMNNIEDVTSVQKGILQTMFNYGTLIIETAGEQNNFTFHYCPNPNAYARAILDSRQMFISKNTASFH